ncbi:MAG: OmpH family outer membrane protein [Alphaproteobacteria bacterium]|nr:OmpH family outer membrane protein [Alphaproteobacteria bacterium]
MPSDLLNRTIAMLKPIRRFVFVVMSVLSLSVATNARAQLEPVIAVVDVDAVIRDSQAMTTLGAQLLELQTEWENELTALNKELAANLRAAQERLDAEDIDQEAFRQVQIRTQRDLQQLRQEANARQRKLIQARRVAEEELQRRLEEIVIRIASDRGANLVFNYSGIVIAALGFDISEQAIQELNQQIPELNITVNAPTQEEIQSEQAAGGS